MAYVKLHHVVGEFRRYFQCEHCGFGQGVQVRSVGVGARNLLQSAEKANALVSADAERKADETLRFVACPECGKTSAEGSGIFRRAVVQAVLASVVVLAVGIVVAFATEAGRSILGLAIPISIGLGFFAGLMSWLTMPAPWRNVAQRVEFLPKVKRES